MSKTTKTTKVTCQRKHQMTSNTAIEASDKKRKKVILEEERVEY